MTDAELLAATVTPQSAHLLEIWCSLSRLTLLDRHCFHRLTFYLAAHPLVLRSFRNAALRVDDGTPNTFQSTVFLFWRGWPARAHRKYSFGEPILLFSSHVAVESAPGTHSVKDEVERETSNERGLYMKNRKFARLAIPLIFVVGALMVVSNAHGSPVMEQVIHSFTSTPDGAGPITGLVSDAAGNLYGTTAFGGDSDCCLGTFFELSPPTSPGGAWSETVLYRFQGGD